MEKKVFIHILGARPNFVKASPVIKALKKRGVENKLLHTGQHYDFELSELLFNDLLLPKPFVNLNIGSFDHGKQTGRMIEGIEKILLEHKTDFVIIYGDTNSTLAAALAAVKLNIPIAHIEAGLRSASKFSPEEINRRVCDHISTINFAPTKSAEKYLLNEGISQKNILFSGDVMYDMVKETVLANEISVKLPKIFTLVTIHRQEHTDNPEILEKIFKGLVKISKIMPVVFPLHPRTKKKLQEANLLNEAKNCFNLIKPQGYKDLLYIISKAEIIISDSGGVPKEAAFLGKKSIVIRDFIIWDELLEQNWASLVTPANLDKIEEFFKKKISSKKRESVNGFGDGNAADKIALKLLE